MKLKLTDIEIYLREGFKPVRHDHKLLFDFLCLYFSNMVIKFIQGD